MRRLLAGALAAAVLGGLPASTLACGALVSPDGRAEMDSFATLISFDGSREEVVTSLRYGGQRGSFGWLLPLPAAPEISRADLAGLRAAARITEPPHYTPGGFGAGAAKPSTTAVEELGRAVVGDLELATLRASGTGALVAWMEANGFVFRPLQAGHVQAYLDRGWVVVAARLLKDQAASGDSVSLRLDFPSANAVYPLQLAGGRHSGTLRSTVYAVTPWRPRSVGLPEAVVRPDLHGYFELPGDRLELWYSAPLDAAGAAALGASVSVPRGAWLTRYESDWKLEDLTSDLVLERSPSQAAVDYRPLAVQQDQARLNDSLVLAGLLALLAAVVVGVAAGIVTAVVLVGRRR